MTSTRPGRRCPAPVARAAGLLVLALAGGVAASPDATTAPIAILEDAADLRAFATAQGALAPAPRLPRAVFLAEPMLQASALSPDGTRVAALVGHRSDRALWIAGPDDPDGRVRLARTPADALAWSQDGRWLFLVSPTQVFALAMAGQPGTGAVAELGGDTRREYFGIDPSAPAAVIVRERASRTAAGPRFWRLWRAGVGGETTRLFEGKRQPVAVTLAPDGRPGHLVLAAGDGHALLRRDGDGWRALAFCRRVERCRPTASDGADGAVTLVANLGGDLRAAWRIDASGARRRLHADPAGIADLDELVVDPRDGRVRVASYRSAVVASHGLDDDARTRLAHAARRWRGRMLGFEIGDAAWLVRERGDTLAGERLHLLDGDGGSVELFPRLALAHAGEPVARPAESALAKQRPVAWRASDGRRIHGFLWLPPGVDAATAPLVTLVHGGPFAATNPGWNMQAQFLANRGHVVFAPEYRGSIGFGRDHQFAAGGDFGGDGVVQRDVVEGTRWLLANGIGDPDRVGIAGASYGGYSTLLGLTFAPDLFKVGAAAVPPSDFSFIVREYVGAAAQMVPGIPLATSFRDLGIDPGDTARMAALRAQSPDTHAAAMARPLLVFAGGEDDRVPIRGVTGYVARLTALGKDVTLFVDADAGHGLVDDRTREAWLYLQESLLHHVFGGVAPEPAPAALRAHLQRNLRTTGPSLAAAVGAAASRADPAPR